jgi:hypothetical protein
LVEVGLFYEGFDDAFDDGFDDEAGNGFQQGVEEGVDASLLAGPRRLSQARASAPERMVMGLMRVREKGEEQRDFSLRGPTSSQER